MRSFAGWTSELRGLGIALHVPVRARAPVKMTDEEFREHLDRLTEGTPRDALLRIIERHIPKTSQVKAPLDSQSKTTPFFAPTGITKITGDRIGTQAGSIQFFLTQAMDRLDVEIGRRYGGG